MSIEGNIGAIRERIRKAAERAGRDPSEVLLLAVTKTVDVQRINEALLCGVSEVGENRVQELLDKYGALAKDVKWHLIGHLQTNKVKYIIDKAALIHSVESIRLAEEINKRAAAAGRTADILVEINIGGEESKFGIAPEAAEDFIRELSGFPNLRVRGLMTVAPIVGAPEENRVHFRKMKQLLVDINSKKIDNIRMNILSMGMTEDYEVAVEEGATIVRIGTGIFGDRNNL